MLAVQPLAAAPEHPAFPASSAREPLVALAPSRVTEPSTSRVAPVGTLTARVAPSQSASRVAPVDTLTARVAPSQSASRVAPVDTLTARVAPFQSASHGGVSGDAEPSGKRHKGSRGNAASASTLATPCSKGSTAAPAPAAALAWQQVAEREALELDCPTWELPCVSSAHLAANEAAPGSSTVPVPPEVAAPPALASPDRPRLPPRGLPVTNVPSVTTPPSTDTDPDEPDRFADAMRVRLRRSIKSSDIFAVPAAGKRPIGVRISAWLRSARLYHDAVRRAALRPGVKLPKKPSDWAIPLHELLRPDCARFVWDLRDPNDVFPMRSDSAPFLDDGSVQIDVDFLTREAKRLDFPDLDLLHQLSTGVRGNHTSPADRTTLLCCNSASYAAHVTQTQEEVDIELNKSWSELHSGDSLPFAPCKLSPQGSVTKPHSSKRRRTCNYSKNVPATAANSVNSTIDSALLPRARMPSTRTFAAAADTLSQGAGDSRLFGVALDISAAYRQLIYADHLLWENCWASPEGVIIEKRLAFGQAASANVFQRLASLLMLISRDAFARAEAADPLPDQGDTAFWDSMPQAKRSLGIYHMYLDDPVGLAISLPRAQRMAAILAATLARAHLPTSAKTQGPTGGCLRVLGLDFLLEEGLLACPDDKRIRIFDQINDLLFDIDGNPKTAVRRRALRSVCYSLSFVAPAFPNMRSFLNEGFRNCGSRPRRDGFVHVSDSLRTNLIRAQELLRSPSATPLDLAFRGKFINGMMSGLPSSGSHYGEWSSDASGGADAKLAIFCRGKFATHECTPDEARMLSIGLLEALAVHAALVSFSKDIKGAVLIGLCDNAGVVQAVNSGACKNPALAECVAEIAAAAADADCLFGLNHIRSAQNSASDALSRNDSASFHAFCRDNHYEPRQIEWPRETVELSARLVHLSREHAAARGLHELVHGPPGIAGHSSFPCDVRISPAEEELARVLGDLSFI